MTPREKGGHRTNRFGKGSPSLQYSCANIVTAVFILFLRMIFVRYWLPLFVWLAVIFGASADAQSTEHTSRFIDPFLRWLIPNISAAALEHVHWLVRKTAHMTEFALMAWLSWRALRKPKRH